jgi:hypothetical protein
VNDIKKKAQHTGTPNLMDMLGGPPSGGATVPSGSGQAQAPRGGGIMSFWPGGGSPVSPSEVGRSIPTHTVGENPIVHMQQELLSMSDDIQKTEALSSKTKQVDYRPEGETRTVRNELGETSTWQPEREAGYKTFLSFLSEYAPTSPGREHSEYAKPGKPEERKFPENDKHYDRSNMRQFDLNNFLQSIARVGKHVQGQEEKPDGDWGPMTQIALENTYAFAKTMLDFAEGMQIPEKTFTNADLREFHNKILPPPKDNQEKVIAARDIGPILQKVRQLFNSFNTKFMEKGGKGWGDYTSQEKAFVNYKKDEDVGKTGLDLYVSKLDPKTVIGNVMNDTKGIGEPTAVVVQDLLTPNDFKKFIDDARMTIDGHLINIANPDEVAIAFNYVKSILNAKPSDLQPKQETVSVQNTNTPESGY